MHPTHHTPPAAWRTSRRVNRALDVLVATVTGCLAAALLAHWATCVGVC